MARAEFTRPQYTHLLSSQALYEFDQIISEHYFGDGVLADFRASDEHGEDVTDLLSQDTINGIAVQEYGSDVIEIASTYTRFTANWLQRGLSRQIIQSLTPHDLAPRDYQYSAKEGEA